MAQQLEKFDSAGGFSIEKTTVIDEGRNAKDLNSLEIKNSFYSDSSTTNYILRGLNTAVLQLDDVGTQISINSSTLNFITGNEGKLKEVQEIIGDIRHIVKRDIDLPEIQEIDAHEIIKDKLERAKDHHKEEFIVEDTSLYLEALGGLPGPLIKWFLKTIGNEGLFEICNKLGKYGAEAKTIIGYLDKKGNIEFFEGSIKGKICSPKGEGFGWDPIFCTEGYEKCFGEFTSEEKNKISMRKIALEKLKNSLTI